MCLVGLLVVCRIAPWAHMLCVSFSPIMPCTSRPMESIYGHRPTHLNTTSIKPPTCRYTWSSVGRSLFNPSSYSHSADLVVSCKTPIVELPESSDYEFEPTLTSGLHWYWYNTVVNHTGSSDSSNCPWLIDIGSDMKVAWSTEINFYECR